MHVWGTIRAVGIPASTRSSLSCGGAPPGATCTVPATENFTAGTATTFTVSLEYNRANDERCAQAGSRFRTVDMGTIASGISGWALGEKTVLRQEVNAASRPADIAYFAGDIVRQRCCRSMALLLGGILATAIGIAVFWLAFYQAPNSRTALWAVFAAPATVLVTQLIFVWNLTQAILRMPRLHG